MKINEVSLKYAAYSTLYIVVAILVFVYLLLGGASLGAILSPLFWIPVISTFLSGYYIFTKIKKAWLLGIIHYILAHIFVLFLYFMGTFIYNFIELGVTNVNFERSFNVGVKAVFYSLFGIQFILPCFILGGYFLGKKLSTK